MIIFAHICALVTGIAQPIMASGCETIFHKFKMNYYYHLFIASKTIKI